MEAWLWHRPQFLETCLTQSVKKDFESFSINRRFTIEVSHKDVYLVQRQFDDGSWLVSFFVFSLYLICISGAFYINTCISVLLCNKSADCHRSSSEYVESK